MAMEVFLKNSTSSGTSLGQWYTIKYQATEPFSLAKNYQLFDKGEKSIICLVSFGKPVSKHLSIPSANL